MNLRGRALVASPYLSDPNFARTVVYMVQHSEEGAVGLVLNRPLTVTVGRRLEDIVEQPVHCHQPLRWGGPVPGPLLMLHTFHVSKNVIGVETEVAKIAAICSDGLQDESRYRVFENYSGWGPGQVERELEEGGWLIWELNTEDIFSPCDALWQRALRQISREILSVTIDPSRIPEDPAYN
ncbi:MAG: UPF0301 protein [Pirellulaceae bacterium]|nr:MAG: UPF0301 protein [Pirellulaceae bacterium]